MAKRFTDTNKWKKPFIKSLEAPYKLLWFYILDECDHAGIWQIEFDIAELRIGEKVDEKTASKLFKDHIQILNGGEKWFIPDFIDFQYGQLNLNNRAHSSVIFLLKKYQLPFELVSPIQGAKDKEQDKELDMDKRKEAFIFEIQKLKTPRNADHIRTFCLHWTELTTDKQNMKFELERTWELTKRLQKWIQNSK